MPQRRRVALGALGASKVRRLKHRFGSSRCCTLLVRWRRLIGTIARELSDAEGDATSPLRLVVRLYAKPPACVLKNGRSQTSLDAGDRAACDYCFERKKNLP